MTTSIHRVICSGLALIIVLLISISMSVCQELSKKLCEGWTRCKGRTCCKNWTRCECRTCSKAYTRFSFVEYPSTSYIHLYTL